MHILVVDDSRDAADSLAMVINLLGHSTSVAYDGPAALEAARQRRPDVVLLDLGLPGMDGYEVACRLREMFPERKMVLVAVTGYGREEDRQRSLECGIALHLVKPVEPEVLPKVLEAARLVQQPPLSA